MPAMGQGHTCLLTFVVISNTVLTTVQLTISLILQSLALFIDSVDMTLDVIGYAMNLFAEWYGQQPGKNQRSRLKLEVASASFTTVCTIALSVWTISDSMDRIEEGMDHDMELGVPMLIFATIGLALNFVSLALFQYQGLPTACHGDQGQLNLCSALLHLIGDVARMMAIFGSGLYIVVSGTEDSGKIDAWCAVFVSVFSMALVVPVCYGLVLTIQGLIEQDEHDQIEKDNESLLAPPDAKTY